MVALHHLSALEMAACVRRGELDPVELVEHHLARVEALSDSVGAFVTVTAETALDQARAARAAVLAADDPGTLAPLLGVPTAIKDLDLTAGVPTKFGSAAYADFVSPIDGAVALRLRAAGTISLGKTNTPEFGLPCYTEPDVAPPARTPWDLARSAGGSSGGAGAAVAAGLVPFAQGSDGGGSIRIPASVCGLVGIKTARGRVSNGPIGTDFAGLSCVGPLARTVRDAAALLDALAGPMPGDPHWAPPLPPGETFLAAAGREPGRLRIGRYATPLMADTALHPDCRAAYDAASELLAALGHEVEDVPVPFDAVLVRSFETVWSVSAASLPVSPEREHLLRPVTRWLRERGRAASALDWIGALSALQLAARAAITATLAYDAVLTPTLAQPPAPVGGLRDDADPARDIENQKAFTPFAAPYNTTGQPAVSLPLHWTAAGLPIGIQLVGRQADEVTLISLAAQLEASCPWAHRRPTIG